MKNVEEVNVPGPLNEPLVVELAQKYNVTTAQVNDLNTRTRDYL